MKPALQTLLTQAENDMLYRIYNMSETSIVIEPSDFSDTRTLFMWQIVSCLFVISLVPSQNILIAENSQTMASAKAFFKELIKHFDEPNDFEEMIEAARFVGFTVPPNTYRLTLIERHKLAKRGKTLAFDTNYAAYNMAREQMTTNFIQVLKNMCGK
jgi:hypothetical protein